MTDATCPHCNQPLIDDPASCALLCEDHGAVVWRLNGQQVRRLPPTEARLRGARLVAQLVVSAARVSVAA